VERDGLDTAGAERPGVRPERTGAQWIAVLVVAVGLLASFAFSAALRQGQEAELQRDLDLAAEAARTVVLGHLDRPIAALRGQMQVWAKHGPRPPEMWTSEAERFLNENPGFEGMARISPELGYTVAAKPDGFRLLREVAALMDPGPEHGAEPLPLQGERVVGPVRLSDGSLALGLQLPMEYGEKSATLFAVVEPSRALAPLLADVAPRVALSLASQGITILELGTAATPHDPSRARELELHPQLGPAWTLRVSPTPELVAENLTNASTLALGAGGLISFLLGAVVHLGQLAAARARALRQADAAWRERGVQLERARSEARELGASLEERVEARTSELNDTVLELETFVYSVSHDLRSPLGAIVNFAAILSEDAGQELGPAGRDHLARITRSAQSAVGMMNALLAFSRTGRQEMHKAWIDVEDLVHSVAAELALVSTGPKPMLVVEPLPRAYADPAMLRVVFQNLLSNAMKFARKGTRPHVEVIGRETERGCEYAVIDDGIGFDMRHAANLFRVFERLHAAESYPGDGVGLAIVARMIRRHGGRITAEGAPDKGATFRFTLPRD